MFWINERVLSLRTSVQLSLQPFEREAILWIRCGMGCFAGYLGDCGVVCNEKAGTTESDGTERRGDGGGLKIGASVSRLAELGGQCREAI
jgi:hypothetical protein